MSDILKEKLEKLKDSLEMLAGGRPDWVLFEKDLFKSKTELDCLMVVDAHYGYNVIRLKGTAVKEDGLYFLGHFKGSDEAIEFAIDKAKELKKE